LTKIERSIVIEAPVEKVFAFVNDFDNFLKTQPPEMEMEVLSRDEGPNRVGHITKVKTTVGNQVVESEVETTEFVENEKVVMEQKGGAMKKMIMTDTFEPTDGGTKWTAIVEYELPYSLLGKLVDKLKFRKELEKSSDYYVNKTKELIEKE
jgi:ribosome-associated toxin RatA of RatAB toxin-antitoxin module